MGNQLSGTAPQIIQPVEYYLNDITNSELLSFDCSLGSTRFFKVARVKLHSIRSQTGTHSNSTFDNYNGFGPSSLGVAKVFVTNDLSLPFNTHKQRIEYLKNVLRENANALPFAKVRVIETKSVILLRQYVKFNLYDRLSTRPFLTLFEKKWICFQLLKSIQNIHQRGICHGDIKLENILVTSFLWVLLTDFASFKPVYLPEDNPADFSYFFDTSRRRTCNVAPERFICEGFSQGDSLPSGGNSPSGITSGSSNTLTPQMDLFSLGCVLAELFSEDSSIHSLFDLSGLLSYRAKDKLCEGPTKVINSLTDENLKTMIWNLIELDPCLRNSTSQHLRELTPSLFPSYFQSLFEYISGMLQMSADGKIAKLSRDLSSLVVMIVEEDAQGLILLLVIVTSSIRSLKHVYAKVTALRLLCDIIRANVSVMSVYILDRILPYLMAVLNDKNSRVRSEAIDSLTFALSCVEDIPPSNNNVFPDYILPILCQITTDKSVLVRITLASQLPTLAQISLKFLTSSSNYTTELNILQDTFQSIVSHLLTDTENAVKITLLSSDISKLCSFFGRQKTNDIILSHIVTFLNDKEGFQLRCAFFDSIVPISIYLGSQSSSILKPLLQQGLADSEETVIHKTLTSLSNLVELNVFDLKEVDNKDTVFELIAEVMPLMCHPNLWIRNSLIQFILNFAAKLSTTVMHCQLMPLIEPYLKRKISDLKYVVLLLDSMEEPIPRCIYNTIVLRKNTILDLDQAIDFAMKRKMVRSLQRGSSTAIADLSRETPVLFVQLLNEGLTDKTEEKILKLSDLMRKILKSMKSLPEKRFTETNKIRIDKKNRKLGNVKLADHVKHYEFRNRERHLGSNMNEEWLQMFGSDSQRGSTDSSLDIEGSQSEDIMDDDDTLTIPIAREAKESVSEKVVIQCPPCVNKLNTLIDHKRDYYFEMISTSFGVAELSLNGKRGASSYRPKGILIAHLQEHSAAINQVMSIQDTSLFVTCSNDGNVKLWDAAKMEEGKSIINRSRQTFCSNPHSAVEGMTFCSAFATIITYTATNTIYLLQIEGMSSKLRNLQRLNNINKNTTASITDISSISPHAFILASSDSKVNAYDLRQPLYSPVLSLSLSPFEGLISSINGCEYCVFCGTANGVVATFDIRFSLRANTMSYPTRQTIKRLLFTADGLYSSVHGNNE
ncbi:phosphoinositide 3-kinase regulatory subunit 4-like protein, partial [Leptotrombidium deliense]